MKYQVWCHCGNGDSFPISTHASRGRALRRAAFHKAVCKADTIAFRYTVRMGVKAETLKR